VAYVRCSTERQDISPEAQEQQIRAWADQRNVEIVSVLSDIGVSGGAELEKRPGLLAALQAVKQEGVSMLVVARRDRLARDVLVAALVERLCEREDVRVVSADGAGNGHGPEAQLMRGIIDVFAQYERMLIRSRTKAALAVKKARGERVGGVPYGWRDEGGVLMADSAEQAVVARARALRAEGLSLRALGRALLEEGHAPRSGLRWHVQVLARLLR
jgi:DNA invertase Pin-like site-specific DNA recombinase